MKTKLSKETVALAKQLFVTNSAAQLQECRVKDVPEFYRYMAETSLTAAVMFEKTLETYAPPEDAPPKDEAQPEAA